MKLQKRLAEDFFFDGDHIGCLLIHGFTGSPSEMRPLGEQLKKAGYTVYGVLLSGHGTTPEAMAKTRWADWVRDAEEGIEKLRRTCDKVIVIGLSMGGLIALHLGAVGKVDGLVAMNAPMLLQNWRARLARLYKPFKEYVSKAPQKEGQSEIDTEERFSYEKFPVACLDSLNRGISQVRRELGQIICPLLLMQSVHDETVNPESVKIIRERLKTAKFSLVYWENSGHILTLGPERQAVGETIIEYLENFR